MSDTHRPLFFGATFFPPHDENKMANEGDVVGAREHYLANKPNNLHYLLRDRFSWMNDYLAGKDLVVELGTGAGFSREFITHPNFIQTDVLDSPWVQKKVDALNMPFEDGSVGALVASHMIHHVATPVVFFEEALRVLEPNGYLIIHEINTSLVMRSMLKLMRHEGYSYDVDVFGPDTIANRPEDPWSANCAVPQLLFDQPEKFEAAFPQFRIVHNEPCECFIFLLSGGVIAKTKTIQLPMVGLKAVHQIDKVLAKLLPGIFALSRKVVLQKVTTQ